MPKKSGNDIDIKLLISNIKKSFNLSDNDIHELGTEDKEILIPVSIFSKKLGMLESTSLYLHEELNLKFGSIANLLHRDYQTIWTSYNKAKKKLKNEK